MEGERLNVPRGNVVRIQDADGTYRSLFGKSNGIKGFGLVTEISLRMAGAVDVTSSHGMTESSNMNRLLLAMLLRVAKVLSL